MRNKSPKTKTILNDDYNRRNQAEMQRRFIDLQFKRSKLEQQLKRVNEVLYSLGKEMEEYLRYDKISN